MRRAGRVAIWVVLIGAFAVALIVGSGRSKGTTSVEEQARSIAAQVKCPVCVSQTVADSKAAASLTLFTEIERRVERGQSRTEILDYIAGRYGSQLILNPPRSGLAGAVWALPVIVLVVAFAGLGVAFRRWSATTRRVPTEDDRALVARALEGPSS